MQKLRIAPAALLLIAFSAPADALGELTIRAEHEPESRAHQLDLIVSGYAGPRFGFIPGIIYGGPVAPQGFISSLNEAFYIEAGILLGAFFDDGAFFWLTPLAGVRWSFYLTQQWAVFGAVRLGWSFDFDDRIRHSGFYGEGTIGAHWHFSESFALRLETGGARFGYRAIVGISWQIGY